MADHDSDKDEDEELERFGEAVNDYMEKDEDDDRKFSDFNK